ncbi:uncharacterized protein LOC117124046 [Anneissia japonica]|uniref:uncharacterized protein LOC117124046 n=1 Tax=Anneissia japonica TaxID=1529436 RepID=UPI001425887F|nr:uncharacterized protein LOC117124046 [Anneissia japonica]
MKGVSLKTKMLLHKWKYIACWLYICAIVDHGLSQGNYRDDGRCGAGFPAPNGDDAICPCECCSQWKWCGLTDGHCLCANCFDQRSICGPPTTPPPGMLSANCYEMDNGADYRGTVTVTVSGNTCQKWTSQAPHSHSRTSENYPDTGLGDHNFCRNPDNEETVWCYTTNPSVRWELCDVGSPAENCAPTDPVTTQRITTDDPATTRVSTDGPHVVNIACQEAMGMESYAIPDIHIQASSSKSSSQGPHRARLHMPSDGNGEAGWRANENNQEQWIQTNLGGVKIVTGVITQGMATKNKLVTAFEILVSMDGESWKTILDTEGNSQVFDGNVDDNTPVTNMLPNATLARYVRLHPTSWNGGIGMRFEILGCYNSSWGKVGPNVYGNLPEVYTWDEASGGCGVLEARLLDGDEYDAFGHINPENWTAIWISHSSEFELVFKAVSGATSDIMDLFTSAETFNDGQFAAMSLDSRHTRSFVNELLGHWNDRNIQKVKVALYEDGSEVMHMLFDGVGSNHMSFFQNQNLIFSPWSDLHSSQTNFFSIDGHERASRRWYINKSHGGCSNDNGWFLVKPGIQVDCQYEECIVYPCFIYNSMETVQTWGTLSQFNIEGKPASQSSIASSGAAGRAVDGNTNGNYGARSCMHTDFRSSNWWKVDLQESLTISSVRIYNRVDCCSDRMIGGVIRFGLNEDITLNAMCAETVTSEKVQNGPEINIDCAGLFGRYLSLSIDNGQSLQICEVQVFLSTFKRANVFGVSVQHSDITRFCRKLDFRDLFLDDIPCNQQVFPAICKVDLDCEVMNGYCSHDCVNNVNGTVCACPDPLILEDDGLTCVVLVIREVILTTAKCYFKNICFTIKAIKKKREKSKGYNVNFCLLS